MVGNFKIVASIVFLVVIISCKKQDFISNNDAEKLLRPNMSVLLDSLEYFDWTKIPVTKKIKETVNKQLELEIIDSILYDESILKICATKFNNKFNNKSKLNFQTSRIEKSFIINTKFNNIGFKNINLVKKSSNDIYTLTIIFSNLLISDSNNYACIVVTKKIGISMTKNIYYFHKKEGKWIYLIKENIYVG